jgi:trafficking protein particle complex subunit 6
MNPQHQSKPGVYGRNNAVGTPGIASSAVTSPTTVMSTTTTTAMQQRAVSEQIMEFLLAEISNYAGKSCQSITNTIPANVTSSSTSNSSAVIDEEESMTVAAEMAAAKLERMGAAVGYRLTERLAENKTWNAYINNNNTQQQQPDIAAAVAAQQLEAVKFLCKELWMEIFDKQIDKLQTNHRGVFVLKDLELKWLTRFPVGSEQSRVTAIRFLAFPCGVLRGALANLGIPAVVSCDFLADGHNIAACSFNIKVK